MKTLLCFILVISTLTSSLPKTRNLDKMNEKERNEYLIKYATKVVKKHGPEYYRKEKPPVINRIIVNEKNDSISSGGMRADHEGRAYYIVTFPHDPNYEYMHAGFAARVFFWADTGIAFTVMFGNGWGYTEIDQPEKYKNEKRVMPYKWEDPKKYYYKH